MATDTQQIHSPPRIKSAPITRELRFDFAEHRVPTQAGTSSGRLNQLALITIEAAWLMGLCALGLVAAKLAGLSLPLVMASLVVWLSGVVIASYMLGLYRVVTALPAAEVRGLVLTLSGSALLITAAQVTHLWNQPWVLCVLPAVTVLACVTIPFVRLLSRRYFSRFSWWGRRVLLVGGDARAAAVFQKLASTPHWGLRPVGVLEEEDELHKSIPKDIYFGSPERLSVVAEALQVSMTIVVPNDSAPISMVDLFHNSESNVNTWMVMPTTNAIPALWTESYDLAGQPAIGWENHLASYSHRFMKRAFDLTLAMLLLPVLLPIIGLISLAIKLTCGGDIFFVQERVGRGGSKFLCRKFRTMHPNGKEILEAHLKENPAAREEWERNFKLKNDPRVTWVGKFLRKTSLDELPQLFNVLLGEMSFVGPRPLLESELPRYGEVIASYKQIVPGITGLWQISGRSNTTFSERAWLDEYYVRNWSPWLDIYILGCTIKVVLRCEGAY